MPDLSPNSLSAEQAYLAMYAYLAEEYRLTKSDELGGLLGGLSFLPDGSPADPAVNTQWHRACQSALANTVEPSLGIE